MEYHAMTYGWLLGEIALRADGRPFRRIVEEEICRPLNIDTLFCGLPEGMGLPGGMPNMPNLPGLPTGNVPGLPKGYTPPGSKGVVGKVRAADRQKARDKRKAEKAARKKNRR